ncbi:MAG: hypothetical protein QXU97_04810 [Fervidicoccaceae archaeon]
MRLRRAVDRSEVGVVVLIPFLELTLSWRDSKREVAVENHFIGRLEPIYRVLMVASPLPRPSAVAPTTSWLYLEPLCDTPEEMLDLLEEGYRRVLEAREGEATSPGDGRRRLRGLGGEALRLAFGSTRGEDEIARGLVESAKWSMLRDLYESSVFPSGKRPRCLCGEKLAVPVRYDPSIKSFRELERGHSRVVRVLNALIASGLLEPSISQLD